MGYEQSALVVRHRVADTPRLRATKLYIKVKGQVQVQVQGTIRGDLTSGLRFVDQALRLAVQASNLSLQERGLNKAAPGCCNTTLLCPTCHEYWLRAIIGTR
jgi:hypothetical protein